MTTTAVGLFEAKTHLSEYVARAEKGEEVIIMRHDKAVAKIVPLHAATARVGDDAPPFVQRTFNSGVPPVELTKANQLAAELEDKELMEKMRRIEREDQERHASA